MAKLAARYLRSIVDCSQSDKDEIRVLTIKGAHTAKLRTVWDLDGMEYTLMGLDIPRYLPCEPYWKDEETGEVITGAKEPESDGKWKFYDKKRNPEWVKKPRIDHRHHALDAITLGCINRNFTQQLNWAEKRGFMLKSSAYPLPLSCMDKNNARAERKTFRNKVLSLLRTVNVSHKPEHSKNGELHKGTGKAILELPEAYKDNVITRYNRLVKDVVKQRSHLSKLLIPAAIKSEWHDDIASDRAKLEKLMEAFELFYGEAEQRLQQKNQVLLEEDKKEKPLSEAVILAETFKIIKEKGLWVGDKFPTYKNEKGLIVIKKHKIGYTSGNNHRVDFYEKEGAVFCEVINNYDINRKSFLPQSQQSGNKPIWSLYQGDLVELDIPKDWEYLVIKKRCIAEVRKFRHGRNQVGIVLDNDARNGENKPKPDYMFPLVLEDKGAAFFCKQNARKIELTPSGKIKKKHKRLWHGKKTSA